MRSGGGAATAALVLLAALGSLGGCSLGSRSADYSYDAWDVSASGAAPADAAPEAAGAPGVAAPDALDAGATGDGDVEALRREVRELRQREQLLLRALDRVRAGATKDTAPAPDAGQEAARDPAPAADGDRPPAVPPSDAEDDVPGMADRLARLHAELAEERRRRQAAEIQLDRLRRETSQAPFGTPSVPEPAYLAAKQEIVHLRRALEEERVARERLAQDLEALQRQLASRAASGPSNGSGPAAQLYERADEAAASFRRTLAASEANAAALERELAAASAAGSGIDTLRAENSLLRRHLEEERQRTRDLAAKLQLAARVTDLIFRRDAGTPAGGTASARGATVRPARRRATPPPAARGSRNGSPARAATAREEGSTVGPEL